MRIETNTDPKHSNFQQIILQFSRIFPLQSQSTRFSTYKVPLLLFSYTSPDLDPFLTDTDPDPTCGVITDPDQANRFGSAILITFFMHWVGFSLI